MRVIIAGSRDIADMQHINDAVAASRFPITQVVCGMARGVDLLGKQWADYVGIPVAKFPADWNTHGKRAGYLRNEQMADNADALIAIWDGKSRGTSHMIDIARERRLKVFVHRVGAELNKASGIVNCSAPGANMYGCQPCPRCEDKFRFVHCDLRKHITCQKCGFTEPITEDIF